MSGGTFGFPSGKGKGIKGDDGTRILFLDASGNPGAYIDNITKPLPDARVGDIVLLTHGTNNYAFLGCMNRDGDLFRLTSLTTADYLGNLQGIEGPMGQLPASAIVDISVGVG